MTAVLSDVKYFRVEAAWILAFFPEGAVRFSDEREERFIGGFDAEPGPCGDEAGDAESTDHETRGGTFHGKLPLDKGARNMLQYIISNVVCCKQCRMFAS